MKVAITKKGKCFDAVDYDYFSTCKKDNLKEKLFAVLDIDYVRSVDANTNRSAGGTLSLIYNSVYTPLFNFRIDNYDISEEMIGRWCLVPYKEVHNNGTLTGNKVVFEAGCMVTDRNTKISRICYFEGEEKGHTWNEKSIATSFVNYLNKLVQFESLEDYITYEEAFQKGNWENKDVCVKILELAKVIELYKKYYEINRALNITHEMEELINKRIKSLINDTEH